MFHLHIFACRAALAVFKSHFPCRHRDSKMSEKSSGVCGNAYCNVLLRTSLTMHQKVLLRTARCQCTKHKIRSTKQFQTTRRTWWSSRVPWLSWRRSDLWLVWKPEFHLQNILENVTDLHSSWIVMIQQGPLCSSCFHVQFVVNHFSPSAADPRFWVEVSWGRGVCLEQLRPHRCALALV